MPLGKNDAPANSKSSKKATDAQVDDAVEEIVDAGAGAPPSMREAAEALPEGDEVEKATKDAMLADTVGEEVSSKVEVVEASPDAAETPSGGALKAVEGISDPIEQAEAYKREKSLRRFGHAPIEDDD